MANHLLNYHDAIIYPSDMTLLDSPTDWLNDAVINFQMTRLQHSQNECRADVDDDRIRGQKRQRKGDDDDDVDLLEDLFLDPAVISFLMHQLTEDDEDYEDELANLSASWKLPQPSSTDSPTTQSICQRKRIFIPISDQFGASRLAFSRPGGGNHWSMMIWEINVTHAKIISTYHHFDSSRGLNANAAKSVSKKLHKILNTNMSSDEEVVVECKTPQQKNGYDCGVLALGFSKAISTCDDVGQYESRVQTYFEEKGGHEKFALRLRKQIGDDIRQLAAAGK